MSVITFAGSKSEPKVVKRKFFYVVLEKGILKNFQLVFRVCIKKKYRKIEQTVKYATHLRQTSTTIILVTHFFL